MQPSAACGVEEPNEGEDRILVPSPKEVPTYDKTGDERAESYVRNWWRLSNPESTTL